MESSTAPRVVPMLFLVEMLIVPIVCVFSYLLFYVCSLHSNSPLYSFIPKLFHEFHLLYEVRALLGKFFLFSNNLFCDSFEFQADNSNLFAKCDSLHWKSLVNFELDV